MSVAYLSMVCLSMVCLPDRGPPEHRSAGQVATSCEPARSGEIAELRRREQGLNKQGPSRLPWIAREFTDWLGRFWGGGRGHPG